VREEKLTVARQWLRDGKSVKETALAFGFCDEFHFSRSYKGRYGHPPPVRENKGG